MAMTADNITPLKQDKPTLTALTAADAQPDIAAAYRVLEQEIEGLKALEQTLGEHFIAAVDLIYNLRGKLVISGMGKSGHVGNKIAATLASTGTPSFFVHPGEASHGDLGMIGEQDAILMLSNSGETAELSDMIHYAKRFNIPIIGMVRRATSLLVEAATVPLVLPAIPEASPTGAPTTSTTMMMALGDCIAVALMERRGFNKEDFGVYHPGGKLGKAFIRVKNLMHTGHSLPIVQQDTPMQQVLLEMTAKGFGNCAVVDANGQMIGIITDGDLRRHMDRHLLDQTAEQVMTANPKTIRPSVMAVEALAFLNAHNITGLFALDDAGKPQGFIHLHDILRAGIA